MPTPKRPTKSNKPVKVAQPVDQPITDLSVISPDNLAALEIITEAIRHAVNEVVPVAVNAELERRIADAEMDRRSNGNVVMVAQSGGLADPDDADFDDLEDLAKSALIDQLDMDDRRTFQLNVIQLVSNFAVNCIRRGSSDGPEADEWKSIGVPSGVESEFREFSAAMFVLGAKTAERMGR